jgi:uncharacterized membrane protein YkvA (DUF1232 family)
MSHVGCMVREAGTEQESGPDNCVEQEQQQEQPAIKKKLSDSIGRFFEQFRVVRRALVHPQVPWHAKAIAGCAVLYVVSPIQLIPNFIPVIGQTDDVVAVMLAIRYLKRHVPQVVLDECKNRSRTSTGTMLETNSLQIPKPQLLRRAPD